MRSITIILMLFSLISSGQNKIIKIQNRSPNFSEVIRAIEEQTQFKFSYSKEKVDLSATVTLKKNEWTVEGLLNEVKAQLNITILQQGKILILKPTVANKKKVILSGTIRDLETGETLPGADVLLKSYNTGTTSNHYGYYSITLDNSSSEVVFHFLGFENFTLIINPLQDTTVDVFLQPLTTFLDTLQIKGVDERVNAALNPGVHHMLAQQIKNIPTLAGEPDPIKALQFLPGIQNSHEGTTNLSVRGGTNDQNLFLLDEATVYNPAHALSFFSVFNSDALHDVILYKSSIPVKYGGRLSSVVDMQMKEGNRLKQSGSISLGTVASRASLEGPIGKKLSYMVAGRYSYAGSVMNGIYLLGQYIFSDPTANRSTTNNKINFYDLNAKINWRKDDRNHFYLSSYSGHDQFFFSRLTSGYALQWGNQTGTFRWNHIHGPRLFSNATAVYSRYNYAYKVLNDSRLFQWRASLSEFNLKQDYDFYYSINHHLTFGWTLENRWILPGEISPQFQNSIVKQVKLPQQKSSVVGLYVGDEYAIASKLKAGYGIRYYALLQLAPYTQYNFQPGDDFPYDSTHTGSGIVNTYHRLDPRFYINWNFKANHNITFSFDRTTQFLHLLSNSAVSLPTDMWMVSSPRIKPQIADIFALGYSYQHPSKKFKSTLSVYDKYIKHISDFKDNANLVANPYIESQILQGKGRSYGLEFSLIKDVGKLQGILSYTLSKSTNQINGINEDKVYASRNDRRHNVKFTVTQKWNRRLETSLNFVYMTGAPVTIPKGFYDYDYSRFNYYTERNGYRLPNYNRMDLSIRLNSKKNATRSWKSWWSLDVYNLYSKKNPFAIYAQQEDYGFTNTSLQMVYIFGIAPSLSFNLTF